ncbi:response regulator transcription factor [Pseudomonas sp. CDFA 602]|uniref:helix-turn-helix domain-containing protein n=1 Tax=Pseudomonas californiensis TaxID=2829823 RepID=UPI001E57C06F|nr:LuxR C-terminal-related transcriptional regulator [Pseudomonas californiensis]MCD5996649.1 response regulator transcription factor [Pseudomonas californiensis]MCD6002280.1 response regulator transcription factor [Pseudomonas californiensis]
MLATTREQEVLGLLLQGCTNKEIAQKLCISGYTVRDHVSSLLRKNQARSRAELMARCVSRLLLPKILQPPTSVGLCADTIHT